MMTAPSTPTEDGDSTSQDLEAQRGAPEPQRVQHKPILIPARNYSDQASKNSIKKKRMLKHQDSRTSICIRRERIETASYWFKYENKNELLSIRFNPFVTFTSLILIIAFITWCIMSPEGARDIFKEWKYQISQLFAWLYIGSQDFRAIFVVCLYFSKYANVKLGKDNDEPEYTDAEWFTMLFACGIGVGLFFFSVSEPMNHYVPSADGLSTNRYIVDGHIPDNTLAQIAMNITFYHWGLHAWVVYCIVGLTLAFTSFRLDLPLTMKSCFYPLIGDKIFGWLGDSIDILSIITTLFGVCTSLGLGALQVNAGLQFLNPNVPYNENVQILIIWTITLCATVSVVTGIKRGIKFASQACFIIGMFLMLVVCFLEGAPYLLNLFIQSVGFYIQNIVQLSFHCDAFEMLGPSSGNQLRGRKYSPANSKDGPKDWMDTWTVFYWSWWIAWSPFVGAFIAKISRGRTIKEFIHGSLTAPVLYSFLWITIFGGSGIKMERNAASVGLCCPNWSNNLTNVPFIPEKAEWASFLCINKTCNLCSSKILEEYTSNFTQLKLQIGDGTHFGSILDTKELTRLSCHEPEAMWFYLMSSYGPYGYFLSVLSLFGLVLYLLTSSDSGSLIIDTLASNGCNEPPVTQRIFWAFVEGACATALLGAGGKDALLAIQTASIVAAFPYTIFLCMLCGSIWRGLETDLAGIDYDAPQFSIGLLDFVTTWQPQLMMETFFNTFIAPFTTGRVIADLNGNKYAIFWQVTLSMLLVGWVVFILIEVFCDIPGSMAIAWTCYIGFTSYVTGARILMRRKYKIDGHLIEDFLITLFMWPTVVVQMERHLRSQPIVDLDLMDLDLDTDDELHGQELNFSHLSKMYPGYEFPRR